MSPLVFRVCIFSVGPRDQKDQLWFSKSGVMMAIRSHTSTSPAAMPIQRSGAFYMGGYIVLSLRFFLSPAALVT